MAGLPGQPMAAPQQQEMQPLVVQTVTTGAPDFWTALDVHDGIFVKQKVDLLEEIFDDACCQQSNKYRVVMKPPNINSIEEVDTANFMAMPYFFAEENSTCMCRVCCLNRREFTMQVRQPGNGVAPENTAAPIVLMLNRPFKCSLYFGCCILMPQEIQINAPDGTLLGTCKEKLSCFSFCFPNTWYEVMDATGAVLYYIKAYQCQFGPNCICQKYDLEIMKADMTEIGKMQNVFPGCNFRGICTKADNLQAIFHQKVPKEHKALLFGALILVDFLHFEKSDNEN